MSTAHWIAAARARESARDDRLFDDPYARELAGERGFAIMAASERVGGGENRFIPVRVRWFDDAITRDATAGTQVVLLGAGLDTRPYRLDLPADVDWFELDRAEVFAAKEPRLPGPPRCRRHVVAGDVAGAWAPTLGAAGFVSARPTLWAAEGLFYYLDEPTVVALLRTAAGLSASGSRFLADLMPARVVERTAPYREIRARAGVAPPFGYDDPVRLFAQGGWGVVRATPPGAPEANYGRLPELPDGVRPGHVHLVSALLS